MRVAAQGLQIFESDAASFHSRQLWHHLGGEQEPHEPAVLLRNKLLVIYVGFAVLSVALYCGDQMLLSQLFVVIKRLNPSWVDFFKGQELPHSDALLTHEALAVVDLPKPHARLLLSLVPGDPDSRVDVKLVIGEEHPPKLAHEL